MPLAINDGTTAIMAVSLRNNGDHGGVTAVYAVQAPQWYRASGVTGVLRTTALTLCFSTAEFAGFSWGRSRHTGLLISLCLYALAGIAPPHIRRQVASNPDRCLQEDDPRHPLHGQRPAKHRLRSRNSFLDSTEALTTSKQDARTILWVEEWNALGDRSTEWRDIGIISNEHLASGTDEPWPTWRSLNRLRVQKGRCRAMMKKWKLSHTDVCDCGETDYGSSYDILAGLPGFARDSCSIIMSICAFHFYIIFCNFFSADHDIPQTFDDIFTT